jgi:hypothetical protein
MDDIDPPPKVIRRPEIDVNYSSASEAGVGKWVEYYLLSHGVVIMAGETALALRMPPTGI